MRLNWLTVNETLNLAGDSLWQLSTKAELIKLQKTLKTDEAIAKKFDVTRQAIYQLRKKYGIASQSVDRFDRNKKIITLRKSGKSVIEVAKKFGISR